MANIIKDTFTLGKTLVGTTVTTTNVLVNEITPLIALVPTIVSGAIETASAVIQTSTGLTLESLNITEEDLQAYKAMSKAERRIAYRNSGREFKATLSKLIEDKEEEN